MTRGIAALDLKLGLRMLVKYPGLTLVGTLAIAFAIGVGAGVFEVVGQLVRPALPLEDGDRVVAIRHWDAAAERAEDPLPGEFVAWRRELRSIRDLGAFHTVGRNLVVGGEDALPAEVAQISASAFRVARVAPLLGRPLADADERPGAPPVVVIGHEVWKTRFGSDPAVVGRIVRLGGTPTTVVGVMPEGFAFPVAHGLWIPLRVDAAAGGPALGLFGRLAPGATLAGAQAELAGLAPPAGAGGAPERGQPQVVPYTQSVVDVSGMPSAALLAANVFLLMLLVLICGNVAMLLFARAATREAEILVRFALGATRGQIVMQFFAEALVLGALGAVAGLAAVRLGLQWFMEVSAAEAGGRLPFWLDAGLSPATLLYAGALTVLVAVIAGVVPALLATRSGVESRLRQVSAGGGGLRFGRMWTWVLVTQVAVTVAFPAAAFFAKRYVVGIQSLDVGFAAEEYLSARIEMDPDAGAGASADTSARFLARFAGSARALERRLATEPGVVAVTFTDHLPRTFHPRHVVEVEGVAAAAAQTGDRRTVSRASVAANYFGALEAPVLAGRGFRAGAPGSGAGGVVVNRSFVAQELGGHSPLGRRVRYLDPDDPARKPGPWHEIVGVVKDLGMVADDPAEGAGLYHPLAPGADYPVYLALRVRGDPESFVPRLRSLAAAVDPRLRLHEVLPLDEAGATLWLETAFLFDLLLLVSSVAVVLSLAGIYSVMSFTVSRRTREIGIRVALGAHRGRIVATIFARPLAQVGLGVAVGGGLTAALTLAVSGGEVSARGAALVMAHMALMVGVCMLAWIVPTRRALRIEPTEALRTDP